MASISIITVNLNNAEGLRRTIESVVGQKARDFEYIVVDGASTDGSLDVIHEYESHLKRWVSESDSGIYQAMNKGIRMASGDYCLFLNSGDWLCDTNVIARLETSIDGSAEVYYADLRISDLEKTWLVEYPSPVDAGYFISGTISHQNALISRRLLQKAGFYREDFKIASDWFFFLYALVKVGAVFSHLSEPIAYYYHRGMSTDPRNDSEKESEHRRGVVEIFGALGPSINELREYRASVYGNIVRLFGYSRSLHFLLKSYRFLARRIASLRA